MSEPSYNKAWWANALWRVVHLYARLFPKSPKRADVDSAVRFYTDTVPRVMPCPECRTNYRDEIAGVRAAALGGQNALFEWTVNLHNRVNRRLHKPEMTLVEANAFYSHPGGDALTSPPPPWWLVIVLVVFVVLFAGGVIALVWQRTNQKSQ